MPDQAALVAGGNVVVEGDGEDSLFQGLVYSGKSFSARKLTLVGAFVANDGSGDNGSMTLDDATVVHNPDLTRIEVAAQPDGPNFSISFEVETEPVRVDGKDSAGVDLLSTEGEPPLCDVQVLVSKSATGDIQYAFKGIVTHDGTLFPLDGPKNLTRAEFIEEMRRFNSAIADKGERRGEPRGTPATWVTPNMREVLHRRVVDVSGVQLAHCNGTDWQLPDGDFIRFMAQLDAAEASAVPESDQAIPPQPTVVVDLNEFISPAERMELRLWRELRAAP